MELDDVLKEPEKTEVVEAPVEEKQEYTSHRKELQKKEWEAQGRDPETGQFIKKEEPKEEPKAEVKEEPKPEVQAEVKPEPEAKPEPKQEMSEKERAFLAAAQEERRKRQELERRIAELEKAKPETGEKKTFWDDPEGHFKSFEDRLTQRETQLKLNTSEAIARSKYKDFDENVGVFAEILQSTPGMHQQWLAAPDPAEFAYNIGKRTRELREVGSVEAFRQKVAKEERIKLEAEFKKKQEDADKQRAELSGSLSDVRGAARKNAPVFTGPTPLDDILAPK